MSELNERDDLKAAVEEAIAARRENAEYMARRDRHVEESRAVLDRLADLDDSATEQPMEASDES